MKKELSALVRVKESQTMHNVVDERLDWTGCGAGRGQTKQPQNCSVSRLLMDAK